jgi:hypothetical protein
MHFSDIIHLTAGLLQLVVASYALRLGRSLGGPRTGGLLFSAFTLLAVAYLFLTFSPFFHLLEWSVTGHTLFAVFLGITFVGMVRLKYLFNQQSYSKKIQLREFQTELETKVVTLTKANEDWVKAYHALEQNVASLHAEMAEQKSATTKLSDANGELVAANQQMSLVNQQLLQTQQQLQQSTAALQEELSQQRMLLDAAAQAAADREAAALASPIAPVIPSMNETEWSRIDDLLKGAELSVGCVANHLTESAVAQVSRIAKLMREHSRKIGEFMTRDPRGRQLPNSLAQLARRLTDEQSLFVKNLDAARLKIERLRQITAPQSTPVNGTAAEQFQFTPAVECSGFVDEGYALQTGQTETATTSEAPPDMLAANLIPITDAAPAEPPPQLLPEEDVSATPADAPLGTSETQTV